jgi:hypothetical protein
MIFEVFNRIQKRYTNSTVAPGLRGTIPHAREHLLMQCFLHNSTTGGDLNGYFILGGCHFYLIFIFNNICNVNAVI